MTKEEKDFTDKAFMDFIKALDAETRESVINHLLEKYQHLLPKRILKIMNVEIF